MWRSALALVALLLLWSGAAASDDAAFGDFEFDSPDEAVERCQEWRIGVLDYDRGAQDGVKGLFRKWQQMVKRTTELPEEAYADETFPNWLQTLRLVIDTNLAPGAKHFAEVNAYAGLGQERRDQVMLGLLEDRRKLKAFDPVKTKAGSPPQDSLPKLVDWRLKGYVTPVKSQGACGSCWIFAGTAAVESSILIKNRKTYDEYPLDLSEQQTLACGPRHSNPGKTRPGQCYGGLTSWVFNYYSKGGVTTSEKYPYLAGDACDDQNNCKVYSCRSKLVERTRRRGNVYTTDAQQPYTSVEPYSKTAIMQALTESPLTFSFGVLPSFQLYGVGIYDNQTCNAINLSRSRPMTNHAMTLVGYNTVDSNPDNHYWIVKNSWGTLSGDNGFYYLKMYPDGYGLCGMYLNVQQPRVVRGKLPPL